MIPIVHAPRSATLGALLASGVLVVLAACAVDRKAEKAESETGRGTGLAVASGTNDSTALADADVKITSTDNSITLAVLRDSVVMQLSDSMRLSVQQTVDSSVNTEVDAGGMGGSVARMIGGAVSKAVTGAMGIALRAPASQVKNLRYEDGRLHFDVEGSKIKFSTRGEGSSDGAPFTEADARRFIAAVQAAQARKTAM